MSKPNTTENARKTDFAQCEYKVKSSVQNPNYNYGVFGQAFDEVLRIRELTVLCLKARGYSEQNKQPKGILSELLRGMR